MLVEVPPRHGKSEFFSHYTPAWWLGAFPDERVALASYEAEFAATWGRKARDTLETYGEDVFGVRISQGSSAADRWDIDRHYGGMVTTGVGGPLTGKGADLLVIDDPVKNAEEAQSRVYRDKHWDWFRSTARTRLQPGGVIVVPMGRWHEDDLIGRIKKESGETWVEVRLPALAEDNDLLGRQLGEPLWPERYPMAELMEIKKSLGSYWWSALYQQKPIPQGGTIFNRTDFKEFVEEPNHYTLFGDTVRMVPKARCWRFAIIDLAASIKTKADWTVVGIMTITPENDLVILNVDRRKIEGARHLDMMRQAHNMWYPAFLGVESGSYQLAIVQAAVQAGLPIRSLKTDKDKFSRALHAATMTENHKVFVRRGADWVEPFLMELTSFTGARDDQDDQVDVLSHATQQVSQYQYMVRPIGWSRHFGVRVYG